MEIPFIPITDPIKQVDIVLDFCTAWDGPIKITYCDKSAIMMPYNYYLEQFCTPEEAEHLNAEIAKQNKSDG